MFTPSWVTKGKDEAADDAEVSDWDSPQSPPPPGSNDGSSKVNASNTTTEGVSSSMEMDREGDNSNLSNTQRARQTTWGQYWRNSFQRDGRTILITLIVIIGMNIPFVQWAFYPFSVFSTWIHELCHAFAALMAGGDVSKIELFPDTSGLAYYALTSTDRLRFTTSAGYQGTAVVGMLMLMIRRTKRGPRAGTAALALMMFVSVAIWIRNWFGIVFMLATGVILAASSWFLSSFWIRNLYVTLSVTCAFNALTSVAVLFGTNGKVNGKDVESDAAAMAGLVDGMSRQMWAIIWLLFAFVLGLIGFLFAVPGPGQSADFVVCGMCQDCGCFYLCNAEGKRLITSIFGKNKGKDGDESTTAGGSKQESGKESSVV
jgi:hypothetical protein